MADATQSIHVTLKESFTKISEQIEELQLSHREWQQLMKSHKEFQVFDNFIRRQPQSMGVLYLKVILWSLVSLFLLVFLLFAVFSHNVIPDDSFLGSAHYHISKIYVETFDGAILDEEQCIVPFHEAVQDLFRPPVLDCSMCAGMTSVDVRTNLTTKEFKDKYAYSSRPLLVTDGMEGWTAVDTFSFQFFQEVYATGSKALKSAEDDCQFFPYKTDFGKLGDVFNMTVDQAYLRDGSNSKPWYIGWSNCDYTAANNLRKHYKKPYFLPEDSESSKVDWLFMGSPGYGAPNHIDAVDKPSWQAQVKGHKIWTLTPPPECYFECGPRMEVTLHPGSIVIVDTNSWFHSTLVIGDEMSITIGSEYD